MMPPSHGMSPFGDSALGYFMYGLEANGFGSMLREGGIPPLLGPEYGDVLGNLFGDSDDSDDSEHEEDYPSRYEPLERALQESAKQEKSSKEQQVNVAAAAENIIPASPPKQSTSAQSTDKVQKCEDGPDAASSTAEEKSIEARNRGNDLYRKGLFDEATKAYFEALSLTPNDSAPLSNLSAVQFELGNYPGSTIYAEKALELLQGEADSNPKKSIKKTREASIRAIDELRRRTDPSFTPSNPTKLEKLSDGDHIYEVREAEKMVIMGPLFPKQLEYQLHICKLVSGKVPSLEEPSSESLKFAEDSEKHVETRKRYDAWKEQESKQP